MSRRSVLDYGSFALRASPSARFPADHAQLDPCRSPQSCRHTDHDTRVPRPSTHGPSLRTALHASRASSPRRFVVALALLAGTLFAPRAVQADITYTFQNYPADQQNYGSPYSITGQIVTDGTTGNLTAADILSWTVTITNTATDQIYGATAATVVA